jgi:hypothetical protein
MGVGDCVPGCVVIMEGAVWLRRVVDDDWDEMSGVENSVNVAAGFWNVESS